LQIIKEAEDIEPFKKTYNNLQFIIKYLLKWFNLIDVHLHT
jgi:hypothetical protein